MAGEGEVFLRGANAPLRGDSLLNRDLIFLIKGIINILKIGVANIKNGSLRGVTPLFFIFPLSK